jgi:hypothetical protein
MRTSAILTALALLASGWHANSAVGQERKPEFTPAQLTERTIHRRAVEAVVWGMPAVNFELLCEAMTKAGGQFNQIVYWSHLPDWKNQTLTPNPDTIYVFPFVNTNNAGPMVLEIPAADPEGSIVGSIDDAWQCALEDVGPAGIDKGKGGKCLILPPGYKGQLPDGYIAFPSQTNAGFGALRSIIKSGSDADIAKAVAYGKRIRLYSLAQAANPPPTKFVDAIDVVFDNTIPYDIRFFELLDRFVQREPWLERDKAMIDVLKSIDIEKGKPFTPDAKMQAILKDAAREAHAWLDIQYEAVFSPSYYEGRRWALPASPEVIEGLESFFAKPHSYPVDGRGVTYSFAYFSAKHLGAGQFYLMTIKDSDGEPFYGGSTYRLTVPAKAPVTLYWSATAYDRVTHALIRDLKRSSRASTTPGLRMNADGSTDVYFGPTAPEGNDSNWIPTYAGGQFEVLFRLYGPEKPLFEKTWKLPDIEKIK